MNAEDWRNATPEQINFWNQVKGKIAWNTITPMYYQGAIGGSEFLTYAATKLYIALEVEFSAPHIPPTASTPNITLRDEADVIDFYVAHSDFEFKPTDSTLAYYLKLFRLQNVYFSRIETTLFSVMRFNGYKLTIV